MALKGKIVFIGDTATVGTSGFQKREFAIETEEQYPQSIGLECVQDKTTILDPFKVGDVVEVHSNLRGRAWTNTEGVTKYFNSLQAWKIVKVGAGSVPTAQQPTGAGSGAKPDDDLPF
jgi:hypothetical protein